MCALSGIGDGTGQEGGEKIRTVLGGNDYLFELGGTGLQRRQGGHDFYADATGGKGLLLQATITSAQRVNRLNEVQTAIRKVFEGAPLKEFIRALA